MRLGDGLEDGVLVERADGAEIDDLGIDAVLFFEDAGGFEAGDDGFAVGDEADVGAHAFHVGETERDEEVAAGDFVVGGDIPLFAIKFRALHEHDGVIVTDGGLHETFGIVGVAGADALHAGEVRHDVFRRVGMSRADAGAAIGRAADDDGAVDLTAGHVADHRAVVDDLVPGDGVETPEHELHDRTHAEHAGADAHADETGLADRGVHEALVTPLVPEALGHFVGTVVLGDFLSHHHDHGVAGDFFIEGFTDGVAVGDSAGHGRF